MDGVTDKPGWRSLHVTATDAVRRMGDTPFGRLARVHAVLVAGDALVAIALAGSLFFSIDPSAARWRVALYLLFTMAPFALVAPLVGPAIDRAKGGRRNMVILSAGLRALVAFMMVGDLDSLLLFPEAFAMLVLGKGYHVAKSAIVPTTVETDEELVEANSKLAVISALAGFAAAVPGLLLAWLAGPEWVLGLAMVVFAVATVLALAAAGGGRGRRVARRARAVRAAQRRRPAGRDRDGHPALGRGVRGVPACLRSAGREPQPQPGRVARRGHEGSGRPGGGVALRGPTHLVVRGGAGRQRASGGCSARGWLRGCGP